MCRSRKGGRRRMGRLRRSEARMRQSYQNPWPLSPTPTATLPEPISKWYWRLFCWIVCICCCERWCRRYRRDLIPTLVCGRSLPDRLEGHIPSRLTAEEVTQRLAVFVLLWFTIYVSVVCMLVPLSCYYHYRYYYHLIVCIISMIITCCLLFIVAAPGRYPVQPGRSVARPGFRAHRLSISIGLLAR